jgi:hypothetical protein
MSQEMIERGVSEYLDIGGFLDDGVRQQTLFDLEAFEAATGRILTEEEREGVLSGFSIRRTVGPTSGRDDASEVPYESREFGSGAARTHRVDRADV